MSNAQKFLKLVNNPLKFRLFLFTKLPSAFFAGARVLTADEKTCVTTVPFKWFSQNPFRSTYFACLGMAAEMSTGILAMAHVYRRDPSISMLVLKVQGDFKKKATGKTTFTCEEGSVIQQCIEDAIAGKEAKIITAESCGRNDSGEIVARFEITWSFKVKSNT